MKLSIVIPCYDEAENIPLILERFSHVIKEENIEVILVNNGSTDNSAEVLKEYLPKYPFAKSVFVPVNKGYGYGILEGLKESDGDFIGWTHADMQTDPLDVIKAWNIIKNNTEDKIYIKGFRKGRPMFDCIFTIGMSLFESVYFGMRMLDINAQPNIFPKDFYKTWVTPPYDFSLDLYAMYMANKQNLKMIRFKVTFPERIHGKSKWNTGIKSKWKFIKRTVTFSRTLKKSIPY